MLPTVRSLCVCVCISEYYVSCRQSVLGSTYKPTCNPSSHFWQPRAPFNYLFEFLAYSSRFALRAYNCIRPRCMGSRRQQALHFPHRHRHFKILDKRFGHSLCPSEHREINLRTERTCQSNAIRKCT